jgi:Domain of unknown function (DUF3471)
LATLWLPTLVLGLSVLPSARAQIAPEIAQLAQYAGPYQVSPNSVAYVTRAGEKLSARLTGQVAFNLERTSTTHFVASLPNSSVEFEFLVEGAAPATALHLHQVTNGQAVDMTLLRISAERAARIEADLAARRQANAPSTGTEAALRKVIERREAGQPPDYDAMTPQMADIARQSKSQVQAVLGDLGRMQSMQFQGVGAQGLDAYLVRFERGAIIYRIALDGQGRIAALSLQPL